MPKLTIEQRVKVVEAYYENRPSNKNAFRALREFFGQHNRPTESAIGELVRKFKQTGTVADVKTPSRARLRRSDEDIAAVRESVAEHPDTSIRHLLVCLFVCLPLLFLGMDVRHERKFGFMPSIQLKLG